MQFRRSRLVVFSLIATIGFLLAAELGVRIVYWTTGSVPYRIEPHWYVPDNDLLYRFRPGFEGQFYGIKARISRQGMRGTEIKKAKSKDIRRILCLGDSRTFGFCVGETETYAAQLRQIWNRSHPQTPVEVLNAGAHGYSSYQGLRYLETRGLAFHPDVVTVAFDFNDRRYTPEPEKTDGAEWFRAAARGERWRQWMAKSYLISRIEKHYRKKHRKKVEPRMHNGNLEDIPCRVDLNSFRRNLEEISTTCREHNIACVFIVMDDTPLAVGLFEEGWELCADKRYDEAIEVFSKLFQEGFNRDIQGWEAPLAHHGVGVALLGKGLFGRAEERFRQCVDSASGLKSSLGGFLIRHSGPYCETVRAVAREHSLPLVDIAKQFSNSPELYSDFCHYTAQGHNKIAQALARAIAEQTDLAHASPTN